jgi:hypothetical protein
LCGCAARIAAANTAADVDTLVRAHGCANRTNAPTVASSASGKTTVTPSTYGCANLATLRRQ